MYALKQSEANSTNELSQNRSTIIGRLQKKLESAGKLSGSISTKVDGISNERDSVVTAYGNISRSSFPTAVPDSLQSRDSYIREPKSPLAFSNSSHNPLSHYSAHLQNNKKESVHNNKKKDMAVIISIGPSKEPVPLMKYAYLQSNEQVQPSLNPEVSSDLIIESKVIQSQFANFVLSVCEQLERCPTVDLEKIRLSLAFQSCPMNTEIPFDRSSAVMTSTSVPHFLTSLRECTSWFNYEIIANIAKHFCGKDGEKLVKGYETQLRVYLQRLVFHCPPLLPNEESLPRGFETFDTKVNWNFSACSLQDVALFKHTLCGLCNLNSSYLLLRSINNKNFQMSWAIPRNAVPHAISQVTSKSADFVKENIEAIKIADSIVTYKDQTSETTSSLASRLEESLGGANIATADTTMNINNSLQKTDAHFQDLEDLVLTLVGNSSEPSSTEVLKLSYPDNQTKTSQPGGPIMATAMLTAGSQARKRRSFKKERRNLTTVCRVTSPEESTTQVMSLPGKSNKGKSVTFKQHIIPQPIVNSDTQNVNELHTVKSGSSLKDPFNHSANTHNLHNPTHRKLTKHISTGMLESYNADSSKSVGFLWRLLGRASPNCHANVHVASIQVTKASSSDDIQVRKGQQLKALYRTLNRVFVETPLAQRGYIPYPCCRLSRKHYGSYSKFLQLSYSQLYSQTPDGADTLSADRIPPVEMVAIQEYHSLTSEELGIKSGDKLRALYCDDSWVYAVTEDHKAGLLPRYSCQLTKKSQKMFEVWIRDKSPFQSDFIVKFNETPPAILHEKPVSITADTDTDIDTPVSLEYQSSSKIGKIFTIVRRFVPNTMTNNFVTIRKGLRVKVKQEIGTQMHVVTKSGVSFWIPSSYLRPARKNSDSDAFSLSDIATNLSESSSTLLEDTPSDLSLHSPASVPYTSQQEKIQIASRKTSLPSKQSPKKNVSLPLLRPFVVC